MKSSVVVSVEFYFKGKKFAASVVVDLDAHIKTGTNLDSIFPLLAQSINIDLYSYEYEVMLSEKLVFSDATGLAEGFLNNGSFDLVAFEQTAIEESISEIISEIASTHLSVSDLSLQPDLRAALFAAFRRGQES